MGDAEDASLRRGCDFRFLERKLGKELASMGVLTAVVNFMIQLGLLACKQRFATRSLTIKFSYTLHIVTLKFDKSNFSLLALSVLQQFRT